MKRFKILLVALAFAVNLLIAPPSWADPDLTTTPEYAEVTQAIDALLNPKPAAPGALKPKPEDVQQQLGDLKLQKYILETTQDWARCRNETGKTLGVYAHKPKQPAANTLFYLADGQSTDDDWNCDGIYLPSGTNLAGKTLTEPEAVKIVAGTRLVAKVNPETGAVALNVPPAKIFKAGEGDWSIPTLAQADIDAQKPNAPIDD
jgi:hypothetical protein